MREIAGELRETLNNLADEQIYQFVQINRDFSFLPPYIYNIYIYIYIYIYILYIYGQLLFGSLSLIDRKLCRLLYTKI